MLRRWKLISFHLGEAPTASDNSKTLVPLKTVIDTLPLALAYLLYMVHVSFMLKFVFYIILINSSLK